ncbi:hypothetical protein QA612_07495 [Evansella sp. AB-P1]|uniref:hypothetical protein n=1 Tax=Evansella sp. AB-P1 TaxID=3037653 RepID=UPI00241FF050|nr:hypothetical protein [Evansella sp. AB-P1]MDG5787335.1 hypothetical protein [Evansella sp. AB-P1]
MKYTLKSALTGLGLLLLITTGCNNNLDTPEARGFNTNTNTNTITANDAPEKDWTESLFGPGPANYGVIREQYEPFDPVTESNNTGKSYRSPSHPHQTIADDQDMIEDIIYEMPGVTPGMVIIMGGHAWVNVSFEEKINGEVSEEQVAEIERRLYKANPRYTYQIMVNDYS